MVENGHVRSCFLFFQCVCFFFCCLSRKGIDGKSSSLSLKRKRHGKQRERACALEELSLSAVDIYRCQALPSLVCLHFSCKCSLWKCLEERLLSSDGSTTFSFLLVHVVVIASTTVHYLSSRGIKHNQASTNLAHQVTGRRSQELIGRLYTFPTDLRSHREYTASKILPRNSLKRSLGT